MMMEEEFFNADEKVLELKQAVEYEMKNYLNFLCCFLNFPDENMYTLSFIMEQEKLT